MRIIPEPVQRIATNSRWMNSLLVVSCVVILGCSGEADSTDPSGAAGKAKTAETKPNPQAAATFAKLQAEGNGVSVRIVDHGDTLTAEVTHLVNDQILREPHKVPLAVGEGVPLVPDKPAAWGDPSQVTLPILETSVVEERAGWKFSSVGWKSPNIETDSIGTPLWSDDGSQFFLMSNNGLLTIDPVTWKVTHRSPVRGSIASSSAGLVVIERSADDPKLPWVPLEAPLFKGLPNRYRGRLTVFDPATFWFSVAKRRGFLNRCSKPIAISSNRRANCAPACSSRFRETLSRD